ncbi:MAG TPA: cytochrome c [Candidatus Binatia bacterium]|nr:cytochrome c [Candidatus Binatia bacterium]
MLARRRRPDARVGASAAAALVLAALPAWGFTAAQVQAGARTYQRQCARCHGPDGQGKDAAFKGLRAPELIGAGALPVEPRAYQRLRRQKFRTAKDVYDFVSATMPADQPAILSGDEYLGVVAYLLARNGTAPDGTPLTVASSAATALHPPHAQAGR